MEYQLKIKGLFFLLFTINGLNNFAAPAQKKSPAKSVEQKVEKNAVRAVEKKNDNTANQEKKTPSSNETLKDNKNPLPSANVNNMDNGAVSDDNSVKNAVEFLYSSLNLYANHKQMFQEIPAGDFSMVANIALKENINISFDFNEENPMGKITFESEKNSKKFSIQIPKESILVATIKDNNLAYFFNLVINNIYNLSPSKSLSGSKKTQFLKIFLSFVEGVLNKKYTFDGFEFDILTIFEENKSFFNLLAQSALSISQRGLILVMQNVILKTLSQNLPNNIIKDMNLNLKSINFDRNIREENEKILYGLSKHYVNDAKFKDYLNFLITRNPTIVINLKNGGPLKVDEDINDIINKLSKESIDQYIKSQESSLRAMDKEEAQKVHKQLENSLELFQGQHNYQYLMEYLKHSLKIEDKNNKSNMNSVNSAIINSQYINPKMMNKIWSQTNKPKIKVLGKNLIIFYSPINLNDGKAGHFIYIMHSTNSMLRYVAQNNSSFIPQNNIIEFNNVILKPIYYGDNRQEKEFTMNNEDKIYFAKYALENLLSLSLFEMNKRNTQTKDQNMLGGLEIYKQYFNFEILLKNKNKPLNISMNQLQMDAMVFFQNNPFLQKVLSKSQSIFMGDPSKSQNTPSNDTEDADNFFDE